jgi:tryptophan-rich sensory protein
MPYNGVMSTNAYTWYQMLVRPSWAPPSWIFGPVWTVLYIAIAVSFGAVFYRVVTKKLDRAVALPFALNIIFNIFFTPLQFGLKNNALATIDILCVLGTLVWALFTIYPRMKWVAYVNIPYLVWVSFATVLQITITVLNW